MCLEGEMGERVENIFYRYINECQEQYYIIVTIPPCLIYILKIVNFEILVVIFKLIHFEPCKFFLPKYLLRIFNIKL